MAYPHISVIYLRVIKWGKDGIIATSDSGICMTITMQIVFAEKSISSTHSMKQLNEKTKGACKSFGAEKTQVDIFVVKGSPRWDKEHTFPPEQPEKWIALASYEIFTPNCCAW